MSSSRSDDETEVGMSTLIVTKWSPRPLPPNLRHVRNSQKSRMHMAKEACWRQHMAKEAYWRQDP